MNDGNQRNGTKLARRRPTPAVGVAGDGGGVVGEVRRAEEAEYLEYNNAVPIGYTS